MSRRMLLFLALSILWMRPASAGPIYASAAIVVRDAVSGKPLEGCRVTMNYADPAETKREMTQVKGNSGLTDSQGYTAPRVYAGHSTDTGGDRITVEKVLVSAEKTGYQSFQGPSSAFYSAIRQGHRFCLFLDELQLSPEGNAQPSHIVPQNFRPEATITPAWGDYRAQYTVQVKIQIPAVLAHEFTTPLLRIGLLRNSKDPRKPDIELNDEGKKLDEIKGDNIYSAPLPALSGPEVIENLAFVMRARDIAHWTHTEEGEHYTWIETKRTMSGLTFYTRQNTVIAVVVKLPVRCVVADTAGEAERKYRERFGPAAEPPAKP